MGRFRGRNGEAASETGAASPSLYIESTLIDGGNGVALSAGCQVTDVVAPALIGELVVFLLLLALTWMIFKEFARIALRVLVPAAILLAVAVWLGFLDKTMVGDVLVALGEGVITGIRTVADWIAVTAFPG